MTTKPEKPKRIPPPRIVFYPNPELLATLNELQEVTGASMSGFVTELMTNSIPMMQQLIKASRLAKAKDITALDVMNQALRAAIADSHQLSLDVSAGGQIRQTRGYADDKTGK